MSRRSYPNLLAFLNETGTTQEQLARKLGISQGHMSRLARGLQQPSLDLALQIERIARVPLESLLRREKATFAEQ